ncbi:MAG: choice-of-anchor V domain-containing protein [Bacteroidia bacterium]
MKKKSTILLLACATTVVVMTSSVLKDDGISGYATGKINCTSCHSGSPVNSSGGSISISSSPAFAGNTYIPGTVYTMSVTIARKGSAVFGLDLQVLNSSNATAGTFAITNAKETRIIAAGGAKKEITHQKNGGLTNDTKTFQFNWTAPAKGSGAATFGVSGVAGNHNGGESGDFVYTTSLALTEGTATSIDNNTEVGTNFSIYPNPTSEKITLNYFINKSSIVTCDIYSLTGTKVASLLNEQQNAGIKNLTFSMPSGISKGIYIMKLNTGENTIAKKLILN